MTDTREATPKRMMKLVTDGAGLQTKIYAESPEGPILMATAVNYDVAEYMASAVNHFDEVVDVLRLLAAEADEWGDAVPDNHRPVYVEMDHWDARYYGSPSRFTVGDLRRIRALLSKLEASHGSA